MRIRDRYKIQKHLGSGGFGDVFLAEDLPLDSRLVIVKTIKTQYAAEPSFLKRFEREAKALAKLNHPEIVGIYDFGQLESGEPFIVMQYIPGSSLSQVIETRTLDHHRSLRLMRQICRALQYAHEHGILHRDLKPANIIITSTGENQERAVLIDFGIARTNVVDGRSVETSMVCLTPLYGAPEQLFGQSSAASDTFALGAILFEMLTHRPLMELSAAKGPSEAVRSILPIMCPQAPEWVADAICHAVHHQPSERTATPAQFAHELESPTEVATHRYSRRDLLKVALALVGGLLGWIAYLAYQSRGSAAQTIQLTIRLNRGGQLNTLPPGAHIQARDLLELEVTASAPGLVYIYSESFTAGGVVSRAILQPGLQLASHASARIPGDPAKWIEIDDNRGKERIWVIWAEKPVAELEALRRYLQPPFQGALPDAAANETFDGFLRKNTAFRVPVEAAPDGRFLWSHAAALMVGFVELPHH